MSLVLSEVAALVGGQISGSGDVLITGAAIIRDSKPGDITLADKHKLLNQVTASRASAVLVPRGLHVDQLPSIAVDNVHASFSRIVEHFRPRHEPRERGVSPQAQISETAVVDPSAVVHAGATVGDEVRIGAGSVIHAGVRIMAGCRLGDGVTVFPNVVLYEGTLVGNRVVIHAGAVIGAYGFGV